MGNWQKMFHMKEFREQFETNFFSVVRMIQKIAPIMRKQGTGNIVNISSIAGRIGFPVSTAYISSKFAIEGLSESLRYELGPFGVNVIIIEPGVIKTNFFDSMRTAKKADESDVYRDITIKVISGVKMMAEMGTPPKEVANVIIKSLKEEKPLPRYVVGNDAAMFLEAKKMKTDIEFENYLKKRTVWGITPRLEYIRQRLIFVKVRRIVNYNEMEKIRTQWNTFSARF